MAERVVLHIGSMKSGTSFIQGVLSRNPEELAARNITFAGQKWRDQVQAVQELVGHGGDGQPPLAADGPWRTMVSEVNATPGTSVISMEFLGPRMPPKLDIIRRSFEADIDVVLTGRDLARNICAMWLEGVQNGSPVMWESFLYSVRRDAGTDPVARGFWKHQGIAAIAQRWSDCFGAGKFTMITVPQPGGPPEVLWQRFAQVLDVDPAAFTLDARANSSIGLATAMVLRQLNETLRIEDDDFPGGIDSKFYDHMVKHRLVKRGLVGRHGHEPKLGLDEAWVRKRGEVEVSRLRRGGHRVIGDLDELTPRPVKGVQPSDVDPRQVSDAAVDALARMVQISQVRTARQRERIIELKRANRRANR